MTSLLLGASSLLGRALALVFGALARVRPSARPLHPRGEVGLATLRREGGSVSGAAFVDGTGTDEVLVRFSRSLGLPAPCPDVNGLAVRAPLADPPGGHGDLLLASTGRGRLTRYFMLPTTRLRGPFLSTLLPYRSPSGPVHLGAAPLDDGAWVLVWARPLQRWTRFATLTPVDGPGVDPDAALSFDPSLAGPDGLEVHDWHRRLREPSYRAARRSRRT